MSRFRIIILSGWVLVVPIVLALIGGWYKFIMPGYASRQDYHRFIERNLTHGALPLLWLVIVSLIGIVIVLVPSEYERTTSQAQKITAGLIAVVLVASSVQWFRAMWDNDKDEGRYDAKATTFYVEDPHNVPQSLRNLAQKVHDGANGCLVGGKSDVTNCIKQGVFPAAGFEPRVSSAEGARIVMDRTSGDNQAVDLNTDSLTYLNASADKPARWTAIRDGSGIRQPMEGVVEWSGTGVPTECTFSGDHKINRALAGGKKNSLRNLFAERYPDYFFVNSDIWGYCDGNQPIVVFPVLKQMRFKSQTVTTSAGVILMRGSKSGNPHFEHHSTVTGLAGPVYPASLAARQRENAKWAAGREFMNRSHFGYDPANSSAQAGNVSEYLLRSKSDGHLYWVTPLTLRGSKSELFVAYSLVRADTNTNGRLNPLSIYVLSENDPRRINVDNLEASARDYIIQQQPGFLSSGGKLIEFTPTDGDIWRAFAELNGRVIYRLDISATNRIDPQLVSLEGRPTEPGTPSKPAASNCGKDLKGLSQAQLTDCLKQFVDELSRRTTGTK